MESIIKSAIAYAQIAVDYEKKADYAEARKYYQRALVILNRLKRIPCRPAERKVRENLAARIDGRLRSLSPDRTVKAEAKGGEAEKESKDKLILVEKPNVRWETIGGLDKVKETLNDVIVIPLKHPDLLKKYGVKPWKGVLLFGPPGCGKTLLAKAAATECEATFFEVPVAEISSKWFGESEKNIRDLFETARRHAPSVIFFDEIDAISPSRDGGADDVTRRIVDQLLMEMDGMREDLGVLVLGATNYPQGVDHALLRPKRFDKRLYIPPPDSESRKQIFKINLSEMPVLKIDYDVLAAKTDGYSGADIYAICNEVGWTLIKEELATGQSRKATMDDFIDIITHVVRPSILAKEAEKYAKFNEDYGVL